MNIYDQILYKKNIIKVLPVNGLCRLKNGAEVATKKTHNY